MQLVDTPATRPDLPPMTIEFKPNPNFAIGTEGQPLISARTDFKDHDAWTVTRWGVWQNDKRPTTHLELGSFDDAVRAATELVRAQRADAKSGWIFKKQDRVDALAVLQAGTGWDLVSVNMPIDEFVEPVPGAMFPGQRWTVTPQTTIFGLGDVRRERADVAALVGETKTYDLRATSPSGPTEPA